MEIRLHAKRNYVTKIPDTGNGVRYDIKRLRQEPEYLTNTITQEQLTFHYSKKKRGGNWGES